MRGLPGAWRGRWSERGGSAGKARTQGEGKGWQCSEEVAKA